MTKMNKKTCYKKDCLYNKEYICSQDSDVVRTNKDCTGFKKGSNYKEGVNYYTEWHLCTKEKSQDVEVFFYPLGLRNEGEDFSIRCCICGGIISNNLSKEKALNYCNNFNFNIIKEKDLF